MQAIAFLFLLSPARQKQALAFLERAYQDQEARHDR